MLLIQRILQSIRTWWRRTRSETLHLEARTLDTLRVVAEQQQRSPEETANSILAHAVREDAMQEELWQHWLMLTPREQQVTGLICLRYTSRQIAERLEIAEETVKSHASKIFLKLGVRDRKTLRLALKDWDFRDWEH